MGHLTSSPGGCHLWLPFYCTALLPRRGRVTAGHAGFPEPLPDSLIMYNQKNASRHTGRYGWELHTLRIGLFFFLGSLLGLGEKCTFTSCCVCLPSKRKSTLKWFWSPRLLSSGKVSRWPHGDYGCLGWILIRLHTCGEHVAALYRMPVPFWTLKYNLIEWPPDFLCWNVEKVKGASMWVTLRWQEATCSQIARYLSWIFLLVMTWKYWLFNGLWMYANVFVYRTIFSCLCQPLYSPPIL